VKKLDANKNKMHTSNLIEHLAFDGAQNIYTAKRTLSKTKFLSLLATATILILALSLWMVPVRQDIKYKLAQPGFIVLSCLWLLSSVFMTLRVYQSAFPEKPKNNSIYRYLDYVPLTVLLAWVAFHFPLKTFAEDFHREENYINGGCGAVILVAGSIHAAFLMRWLKQGASTQNGKAGALAALASGCFASFLIQFGCANENPIHTVLWHLLPLSLLAFLIGTAAQKILKW
jgi:hypothetical protein